MRSPAGASKRRRDDSRGAPDVGSGASLRQLPENFGSSSAGPKPDRSFAEGKSVYDIVQYAPLTGFCNADSNGPSRERLRG